MALKHNLRHILLLFEAILSKHCTTVGPFTIVVQKQKFILNIGKLYSTCYTPVLDFIDHIGFAQNSCFIDFVHHFHGNINCH